MGDGDAVVPRVGDERWTRIAVAQSGRRTALPIVDLAAVLVSEIDGPRRASARNAPPASIASSWRSSPTRASLPAGGVDRLGERCEGARAGHAGFVDDKHGPGLQWPVVEPDEQGADACARDSRTGLELAGRTARDRCTADRRAGRSPGFGARPQREGLAGAGDTDDHDDPVSFAGQWANGRALLVGERWSSEAGVAQRFGDGHAATGAAPPTCQFDEAALGGQQLRRRPVALVTARQGDDAIAVEESRRQRFGALDVDGVDGG